MSDWLPVDRDDDGFVVTFRGEKLRFVRHGDWFVVPGKGHVRARDVTFDEAGASIHAAAFRWLAADAPGTLATVTADFLVFLAITTDYELDPDLAVNRLEHVLADLEDAPAADRAAVRDALRLRSLAAGESVAAEIDGLVADLGVPYPQVRQRIVDAVDTLADEQLHARWASSEPGDGVGYDDFGRAINTLFDDTSLAERGASDAIDEYFRDVAEAEAVDTVIRAFDAAMEGAGSAQDVPAILATRRWSAFVTAAKHAQAVLGDAPRRPTG